MKTIDNKIDHSYSIGGDAALDFDDVLIIPNHGEINSRKDVSLIVEYTLPASKRVVRGIPLIAANMDTTGVHDTALVMSQHQMFTALHKFTTASMYEETLETIKANEQRGQYETWDNRTFFSIGIRESISIDLVKVARILGDMKAGYDSLNSDYSQLENLNICLDVPNGHMQGFLDLIEYVRETFPTAMILAGNVATPDGVRDILKAGADIVKIGIGPGSACTTRIMTGVGIPQVSAILRAREAAEPYGGLVCADGGCKNPGDIAKAFVAGAHFVMLGGMLAGHDESAGRPVTETRVIGYDSISNAEITEDVIVAKEFYGMSSRKAMNTHYSGVSDYRAAEGKAVRVPYRGPLRNTLLTIQGGLRSACSYVGVDNLGSLFDNGRLVPVRHQYNDVFGKYKD